MRLRRRQPRPRKSSGSIPLSTLTRWLTYDIGLPDKSRLAPALGLVPISDDVEYLEIRDSNHRLTRVAPIGGVVENYAKVVSKVTVAAMAEDGGSEALRLQHEVISQVSIIGFLSAFLELGLISGQYPGSEE